MDDRQYASCYDETHAIASLHGKETIFNPIKAQQKLLKLYYGQELNDLCFQYSVGIYKRL